LRSNTVPHNDNQSSKPSLAVLPFANLSGNVEQEYFSDGITEDIITDLSQVSALSVVPRGMAFTFKGKPIEFSQVAHKLNVGYLLEGSVRRAGNRVRITAQLVNGLTGGHLWAERYDREIGDVFALQDDIARSVVEALKIKLLPAESRTVADRSTANAEAYEFYLRGRAKFFQSWGNVETLKSAHDLFNRAVEVDSGYVRAYAGIADCDAFLWINGELDISFDELLAVSAKALSLAPDMAEAHACRGMALYVAGRAEEAATALERAVTLGPLLFGAHLVYAHNCRDRGDFEKAAAIFERAAELRSDDFSSLTLLANVYELQGHLELAMKTARRSLIRIESTLERYPNAPEVLGFGAATLVYLGENARAVEWAERAIALEPGNYAVRYNAACAYAVIGMADTAMKQLEYIVSQVPRARRWLLKASKNDPQLNALRHMGAFQKLVESLAGDMT
jgi:adenylate cyclase